MKKSLFILFLIFLLTHTGYAQWTVFNYTITNVTGTYDITCATPSINLTAATNYTGGPVSYTWASATTTLTGPSVTITSPGNYSVTVEAVASPTIVGNSPNSIFTVTSNTTAPSSTVSPVNQLINCQGSPAVITATASPASNVQHNFISPFGGTVTANTGIASYNPLAPGTYTHMLINTLNGCITTKTFALSGTGFPTFSLTSPSNFTLGCGNMSLTSVMINPTGPGTVNYTVLPPGSGNYNPGPISTYTMNTPGTWTAIVRDVMTNCESVIPFSIVQNTIAPSISPIIPTATLSCS